MGALLANAIMLACLIAAIQGVAVINCVLMVIMLGLAANVIVPGLLLMAFTAIEFMDCKLERLWHGLSGGLARAAAGILVIWQRNLESCRN